MQVEWYMRTHPGRMKQLSGAAGRKCESLTSGGLQSHYRTRSTHLFHLFKNRSLPGAGWLLVLFNSLFSSFLWSSWRSHILVSEYMHAQRPNWFCFNFRVGIHSLRFMYMYISLGCEKVCNANGDSAAVASHCLCRYLVSSICLASKLKRQEYYYYFPLHPLHLPVFSLCSLFFTPWKHSSSQVSLSHWACLTIVCFTDMAVN